MVKTEAEILTAACERAASNIFMAAISSRLREQEEQRKERLEKLAEEYPVGTTDLNRMLFFIPRWSKVRACVDFAISRPKAILGAELGQTKTHWVFAILQDDGK